MNSQPFELRVVPDETGTRVIDFSNASDELVEVVFTVDGKEVKTNKAFSPALRGYCYPSGHHKPIRKSADGTPLTFMQSGTVRAVVYAGEEVGRKPEDMDVPTFIWRKMRKNKVRFRRTNTNPIAELEIPY